jgi:predicted ATPase
VTITRLEVGGYRSLRSLKLDFDQLTVIVGANGTGKTNLYRALQLLHGCAVGDIARRIVSEGGMQSVVWAGPRKAERKVELAAEFEGFRYEVTLAEIMRGDPCLPVAFIHDPVLVSEQLLALNVRPKVQLLDRIGATAFVRDDEGHRIALAAAFRDTESVLSQLIDPFRYPELLVARERLRRMRFHHQLRTDDAAPARQLSLGTRTQAVADDGADLAAALRTIEAEGDGDAVDRCVRHAFDGASVVIEEDDAGRLELQLATGHLSRSLRSAELSDGQLRFLFLTAVLLAPSPAEVVVLNEPESSLHADLLPALADLLTLASKRSQIVLVTHASELLDALRQQSSVREHRLSVIAGATTVRSE